MKKCFFVMLSLLLILGLSSPVSAIDDEGDSPLGPLDLIEATAKVKASPQSDIEWLKLYIKSEPRLPGIVVFECDVDNTAATGGSNSILGSPVAPCQGCACKCEAGMDVAVSIFLREQPPDSLTSFCASCSDGNGTCGKGRRVGEWYAVSSTGGQPIRQLGVIRGLLRPSPKQTFSAPFETEDCFTLPWYSILGFAAPEADFSWNKAQDPANHKWQVSIWYDANWSVFNFEDDFTDGPLGPFNVNDWAPNVGKADMLTGNCSGSLADCASDSDCPGGEICSDNLMYCEGNFDGDQDVDGGDAARFKQDFGRSGFKNPCPDCGPF